MGGTGVVDRFLDIFSRYIDSGFGLLSGEVAFIATTLIVIDVTLAALFWSWGEQDDIIARLVKKTLFVGVFAYIIGNWNNLARIVFESFAGLGLKASGTGFTAAELLQPGRVAQVAVRIETGTLDSWQANSVAPQSWPGFTILQTVRNSYDTIGQLVKTEAVGSDNAVISVVQTNYDRVGRPGCTAVRMNPAEFGSLPGNACDLDTAGALGSDRIARNYYDVAGQMTQMRMAHGTNQEIAEVSYTYTPNGQQQFVIDANGNRAEMRYDGFDRLQRWIFPSTTRAANFNWSNVLGSTPLPNSADFEEYTYDRNGNRTQLRKRDGQLISFQYDALNRVTRKVIPGRAGLDAAQDRDVVYRYDLRDLVLSTTFDTDTGPGQRITYNGFGEAVQVADNSTGTARVLRYGYNANGNRTDMWYPDDQRFTYGYDIIDRLTQMRHNVSDLLIQQAFNNRGLMERVGRNSTAQQYQAYGYDQVGRLSAYSVKKGGAQFDVEWAFQRNASSQITQETRNNAAFAWDGAANITRNYTTNGLNQYTQASSAQATDNFCYDANGSLTADADEVFKYDLENRMVEKRARVSFTTCPNPLSNGGYEGALIARLDYDPLGRLYRVIGSSNNATMFVHDGNAMVAEYSPTGSLLQRYVHGTNVDSDDPLVWYPGSDVTLANMRNLYSDQRGSIALVSDNNGAKVALNTFDEYGNNGTQNAGRFQFTGQVWLEEAQLYYYKARIYSPKLGRFLQVDPIGYEDQYNLYAYVGNDPINLFDPEGTDGRSTERIVNTVTDIYHEQRILNAPSPGIAETRALNARADANARNPSMAPVFNDHAERATKEINKEMSLLYRDGATPTQRQLTDFAKRQGWTRGEDGSNGEIRFHSSRGADPDKAGRVLRIELKPNPAINSPGAMSQGPRISFRNAFGQHVDPVTGKPARASDNNANPAARHRPFIPRGRRP